MPVCAIYCRVSTDCQGDSISHQKSLMTEYAIRQNTEDEIWEVSEELIYEDEAFSGAKISIFERPAMARLIEDAKAKKFDTILFKGISRFARDTQEALTILKRFETLGIRVISYEENFDSSKGNSDLLFTINAAVAEEESKKIGVRVSLGNKEKAKKGKFSNSTPPYGYIRDKATQKLILGDDTEVNAVKLIFDLYVNRNLGSFKIAETLNKQGITTSKGNMWSRKTIKDILKNEAYIGNIVHGKTRYKYLQNLEGNGKTIKEIKVDKDDWVIVEDAHPGIIDKVTFEKAQQILKSRNIGQTFKHVKHPLTGLLKCGKCENGMVCQKRSGSKKDYRYYICKTYHKYGRDVCSQTNINADEIEKIIYEDLLNELIKYKQELESNTNDISFSEKSKKDLTRKINSINKKLEKLNQDTINLIGKAHMLSDEQFSFANEALKKEIKLLQDQKQFTEEEMLKMEDTDNDKLIKDSISLFFNEDNFDIEKLRKYFHIFISSVIVKDGEIEVNYKFNS